MQDVNTVQSVPDSLVGVGVYQPPPEPLVVADDAVEENGVGTVQAYHTFPTPWPLVSPALTS